MYPANVSKVGFNPAGVLLNPWGLPFPWIPMQIVPQLPSWPGMVIRELHCSPSAKSLHSDNALKQFLYFS